MLLLIADVENTGHAGRMVRIKPAELLALRNISTDGVTTSARLRRAGPSASTIAARCRLGGPWRRLLPGVILLSQGEPTRRQQIRAAVLHTGPDSVVSGLDALRAHGLPLPNNREVRMLVPHTRRILSREFLAVERTSRLPHPVRRNGIPVAPPARAAIDAARQETDTAVIRRILSLTVYHGLCTREDLQTELEAGNQRGSAAVREILRRLGSMNDTYLHGVARRFLKLVPLPPPTWNMTICDRHVRPIGVVGAWWDEVGLGWQFDAREIDSTQPKLNDLALTAAGVVLVRTSREQLCANDAGIARELASAFASAARRRRPNVLAYGGASATGSVWPANNVSSKTLTTGTTVSNTGRS